VAANSGGQRVEQVLAFHDRYLFLCANQANGANRFAPIRSVTSQRQWVKCTVRRLDALCPKPVL
jgi:hypothetical protein